MNGSFTRKRRHLISRRGQAHFDTIGRGRDAGKKQRYLGLFQLGGFVLLYVRAACAVVAFVYERGSLSVRCGATRRGHALYYYM